MRAIRQGRLEAKPPFDFDKTLVYLRSFPPTAMDQAVTEGSFIKAFQVQGRTLAASVESSATFDQAGFEAGLQAELQADLNPTVKQKSPELRCDDDKPYLNYTLFADESVAIELESDFTDRLGSMLGLTDTLAPFYALAQQDPKFMPILKSLFGYHPVRFQSGFEAAVWAILSQRNRMATARNMYRSLVRTFGHKAEVDGIKCWAFPEPEELAGCSEGDLAMVARNLRRGEFLIDAARAFAMIPPGFLASAEFEEVESWLRGINGIGPWSASFVLWRGLGRSQTVPLPDRAFLDAASRVYGGGTTLSDGEVMSLARRYHPWQGYWAHYLRIGA